uniref:Uncharacterized protein n=1 Tax=Mustela putorius furo TaxID=9669 RepID=M3YJ98_MUSPF
MSEGFIPRYHKDKLERDKRSQLETGIKIVEENIGSNLFDIGHGNFFQDMYPKAKETKVKMNFWDFIKIKSFCTAKEAVNKTNRQPMEWEKIFTMTLQTKG